MRKSLPLLLLLFVLTACGAPEPAEQSIPDASPSVPAPAVSTPRSEPEPDPEPGPEPAPAGSNPVLEPEPEPVPVQEYDFSQPVPERETVELEYFDDAAFVGDSRTDGFLVYSGIGRGANLTSNGLSIFKLADKKALKIDGQEYTLLEALELKEYGKIYFSLGVNELGYFDDDGFYRNYCAAIDAIRAAQPQAVIYIQGLIPLNEKLIMESSGRDYLTNEHLRVYNDLMRQVAEEKQVAFLDLYNLFVDEDGSLPEDASRDGVHLRTDYCKQWLEYLQTHTVDYETMYPEEK